VSKVNYSLLPKSDEVALTVAIFLILTTHLHLLAHYADDYLSIFNDSGYNGCGSCGDNQPGAYPLMVLKFHMYPGLVQQGLCGGSWPGST
jgi:hypothetical protein